MSALRIFLFGGGRVLHQDRPEGVKLTRGARALLAYFLLYRRSTHSREVLAGLFWGDQSEERARSCLNTALWRLRSVLEPSGVPRGMYLTVTATGQIGFNGDSDYWLDVEVLEQTAERLLAMPVPAIHADDASSAEAALLLHSGELLEGCYEDWVVRERERLRLLYVNSLIHLLHYHEQHGAVEQALTHGLQILQLDPLREEVHRDVMRLYESAGQRPFALKHYETCRRILDAELGVLPMEETRALHARLLATAAPSHDPLRAPAGAGDLQQVLKQFRRTAQDLDALRRQVRQAIRLLEHYTGHQG